MRRDQIYAGVVAVAGVALLSALLYMGARSDAPPPLRPAFPESEAIKATALRGGQITRDLKHPDFPVIGVRLEGVEVTAEVTKDLVETGPLTRLELLHCGLTDAGVQEFARLDSLAFLWLDDVRMTDGGFGGLAGLQRLTTLYLWGIKLTDARARDVGRLKGLETLHLAGSDVTAAGVKELTALDNLTRLELYDTQLTGAGRKELANFKRLTELGLFFGEGEDAKLVELRNMLPRCKING